jgi:hypothetical protein
MNLSRMNKITYLNEHWFWPVLAVAIILSVIFIWKELAQRGRRRLTLKIIFSFFAIAALALIALKPALQTSDTFGKIALITPGYEKSQLDSLKKIYRNLRVLDYSMQNLINQDIQDAKVVYILGQGIKDYDLENMEKIPAVYLQGPSPEGIVKIKFPEKATVGDTVNIHGLYRNFHPNNRIILEGPGGLALDSVDFLKEEQQFKLATTLKAAGNFVFHLIEKNPEGKIITREPVPVSVEEKEVLRILILNNFPTFETKYLKNFLAEAGHELVVRSQITQARFKYEYFNTNRTVSGSLAREILNSFDLLIIDAASMRSITGSQLRAVENAVRGEGLGVLVQPDDAFFISPGSLVDLKFKRERRNTVSLEGPAGSDVMVYPFSFETTSGQENINRIGNTVIAGYHRKGEGRIGTTILSGTWQLVLEGNDKAYRQIWSRMIDQISKREELPFGFHQLAPIVLPNEPYRFNIVSPHKPLITHRDGRIIPLAQDVNISEQWKGTLWPEESGWNSLQQDTTAVFNYYVAEENSWRSLIAENRREVNKRYFDRPPITRGGSILPEPINPLWFYSLFLICMGGLWLEPKIS